MSLLEYYIAPAIQEKQGPYRMIRNAGVNQQQADIRNPTTLAHNRRGCRTKSKHYKIEYVRKFL